MTCKKFFMLLQGVGPIFRTFFSAEKYIFSNFLGKNFGLLCFTVKTNSSGHPAQSRVATLGMLDRDN
jgi:hypothetical protein